MDAYFLGNRQVKEQEPEYMWLDSHEEECIGICFTNEKCINKRIEMTPFCFIHKNQKIASDSLNLFYKNIDLEKQKLEQLNDDKCCICFESYMENGKDEKLQNLSCRNKHDETFVHLSCENKWRSRTNKCPICRTRFPRPCRVRFAV